MSIVDQSTADTVNSRGVIVASSASANTKGSWVEMVASTSEETFWISLVISSNLDSVNKRNFLVDIGTGGAGSEVVKIADVSAWLIGNAGISYLFPLTIASGVRVSVRCANSTAAATSCQIMMYLSNDSSLGTSTVNATFGTLSASSVGTICEADLITDNTKGAYAELESSTSTTVDYIVLMIGGNDNETITPGLRQLVDVSIGAGGSEVDFISNVFYGMPSAEVSGISLGLFHSIASGTRLTARCQANDSVAAGVDDAKIDVSVIGFTMVAPSGGGGLITHPGMDGGIRG